MIGSAALGLAFTSAVAADVASGGRIEIPVVHQVVQAIPVFKSAPAKPKPVQLAARAVKAAPKPAETLSAVEPAPSATRRDRLVAQFAQAKQKVAERRAAGLPTPTADRIERKAKRIVERRETAGLPVPALDEVELRVALREWRTMRFLRQVARDPANLTVLQLQRFARILPPQKRTQFLALAPEQQRQLMSRAAERFLARRMQQRQQLEAAAATPPAEIAAQQNEGSDAPTR
jgi:hypothetical protein